MHVWRAAALSVFAVVVATVATVATVAPAAAGGPTSVLLVAPETGQTASLYTSDDDYQALARLVGAFDASPGETVEGASRSPSGRAVTITWLIHDVQVWRVDRVYPDAEGGPLVATQQALDAGSTWEAPVAWHRPAAGTELAQLLDRLVLAGGDTASGGGGQVAGSQPAGQGLDAGPADPAQRPTSAGDGTAASAAAWVLLGSLIGAVLALVTPRAVAARRRSGAEVDHVPDGDWVVTDELSSTAPRRP